MAKITGWFWLMRKSTELCGWGWVWLVFGCLGLGLLKMMGLYFLVQPQHIQAPTPPKSGKPAYPKGPSWLIEIGTHSEPDSNIGRPFWALEYSSGMLR